jgi:Domain of unknown function (DUF222)
MGILAVLEKATADIEAVVADVDPERLGGDDAAALAEMFARGERLCAAGKALVARRVADVGVWRAAGERSAAHWLARRSGSTVAAAVAALETAQRLQDLPVLDEAYRDGRLSQVQAQEIASSAAANPAAQRELLGAAANQGVKGLRDACRKVSAAAVSDESSRYQAIHRGRYLRSWVDADGAGRLDARLTADALAAVLAGLEPFENLEFEAARSQGRREPYHAYAADALVAMARRRDGGGAHGYRIQVNVLIDHAALIRGWTEGGETCYIAGVGPVPVATVRAMMTDAFLAAVVTDGVDVYTVAHLGRTVTAHQRTALQVRDPECVVPACHVDHGLEIDHVDGWAATKVTKLDRLVRACHFHHYQKTYEGYQIVGRPGQWQWLRPDGTPVHPEDQPP